jgi:sugar phosphate isomerase/epimerase
MREHSAFFVMYSLSTCWNSNRHTDGRAMLNEIRELGFEYAELSHGIRISLLPGIIEAVEAREMKISTLHNFCPLPIGVNHAAPNIFKFTSFDARERENALRHSVRTIETAARLNAPLVVLHMGCIDMKDYTRRLIDMVGNGEKESPKYAKLCLDLEEKRESKKEKPLQLAGEMLMRILEKAKQHGVKLGIENREALEEVPLDSDFQFFFREFDDPLVCYWHDTGHAQIKENLGFIHHAMHLESMVERLAGFHIHDVLFPARDHCPPGRGMIDFAALQPFVRPEHIKVFELSPGMPLEELQAAVAYIKSIWGEE